MNEIIWFSFLTGFNLAAIIAIATHFLIVRKILRTHSPKRKVVIDVPERFDPDKHSIDLSDCAVRFMQWVDEDDDVNFESMWSGYVAGRIDAEDLRLEKMLQ